MEQVQDATNLNQVPLDELIKLGKLGAKAFSVSGINAFLQYTTSISPEGNTYIHTYINGRREEDLFIQIPILRKENDKMMFLHMAVGKDEHGWRVIQ